MKGDEEDPQPANVTIRLASLADAVTLARLRYEFRASLCEPEEPFEVFVARCERWMKERLQDGNSWRCWIGESDGAPVGHLWVQLIEKIPNPISEPEQHAYLTNFYVREANRGRGVGSRLLAAAMDWIQGQDVHAMILWPTDESRTLYLRNGFAVPEDLMEKIITNG
ncbi:MAG TPA: GNAT family N-acetyltransferase [Pyrinomonadaceae bacterium]|nr:GNAT family N-acetyltransferase [Pyrinomonadaceae bacterium]